MPKPLSPSPSHNKGLTSLLSTIQAEIHLPDPGPLLTCMGTVAANMMSGPPTWMMLVGPPGDGKTVMIMSMAKLERTALLGQFKNSAAFLTWDKGHGVGGVLHQVGSHGMVLLKDYTTVTSLPKEAQKEVKGVLRECYDGTYVRNTGSNGGKHLEWSGKLGAIGGVTPVIDRSADDTAELGERWLFYRTPRKNDYQTTMAALAVDDFATRIELFQHLVVDYFHSIDLTWGNIPRRLTPIEQDHLTKLAITATRLRSIVPRHNITREVIDLPQIEVPMRVAAALRQLYLGLERIGCNEVECWRIVTKVALDCCPALNLVAVKWVLANEGVEGITTALSHHTGVSSSRVGRLVKDLEILGVIRRAPSDDHECGYEVVEEIRKVIC